MELIVGEPKTSGDRLRIEVDFLEWLKRRGAAPLLAELDPYNDHLFDARDQAQCHRELTRLLEELVKETEVELQRRKKLPRDATARAEVLRTLVEVELAKHENYQRAREILAALGRAAELEQTVHLLGA